MQKEILVLAKSTKPGGFCVAGPEVLRAANGSRSLSRNWIRPVAMASDGEATRAIPAQLCANFAVLDLITVDLSSHMPLRGQPENWLWQNTRACVTQPLEQLEVLDRLVDPHISPWNDPTTDRDDEISTVQIRAKADTRSLMLIAPQDLVFHLELQNRGFGLRRRVFASFAFNGGEYQRIPVTDPIITRIFAHQFPDTVGTTIDQRLNHGSNYWLTLSLSACFGRKKCHYMLVAAVIDQTGYLNRSYR